MTADVRGAGPARLPAVFDRLAEGLADPAETGQLVATRPGRGARGAAVLALFGALDGDRHPQRPDQLTVTLIERSHTMRSHPGQISFPGGAVDQADTGTVHTALREATEEIGLAADSVDVVGAVPSAFISRSQFDVVTVVGWWRRPHPVAPGDPAEVHDVVTVPLATLLDPVNRVTSVHPSGYRGPAFWVDDLFVWGLTAHLLDGIIDLAGWSAAWDRSRQQSVPDRFMKDRGPRRPG